MSILANTFFKKESKVSRTWKPSVFGEFLGIAFYLALEGTQSHRAPSSLMWSGLASPQVEAFCCLVVVGKVSTVDNLRTGLTSNNL